MNKNNFQGLEENYDNAQAYVLHYHNNSKKVNILFIAYSKALYYIVTQTTYSYNKSSTQQGNIFSAFFISRVNTSTISVAEL